MPNNTLTKTCASCGLQKPLSAFLQIAGPEGTTYGNICSTCRKAQRDKTELPSEPGESSSTSTGFKIDTKTETKRRQDEKDIRTKSEEQYEEERDKAEERQATRIQKVDKVAKEQKTHRESFLDKPIEKKDKKTASDKRDILTERAEAEQQPDLTGGSYVDTAIAGKIKKTYSSTFNQFATWLPGSSPIAQAVKKAIKIGEHRTKAGPSQKEDIELPKDAPDYVKKITGPKSR